ncbi:MAG: flagellar filament capping protein FliD [Lachnospiraceae bacterium]|nr:flagellar filament capping protein FliD [Lachnospiraceae bacterium]
MTMRISGIASGLDTDSMVQELVKASSSKKESLEKAQTKLEWKQEAWKTFNTKVYSFFNNQLNNLKYESAFNKKKTTIADSSIASIVTGDNAVNGTQTLSVKRLAKSGYLTGGKLSSDKSVTGKTTLAELAKKSGTELAEGEEISLRVKNGSEESTISLSANSTVSDVVSQLKEAGLTANFDETNQRIFISASGSGAENDFAINASSMNGLVALSSLGLLAKEDIANSDSAAYQEYQYWNEAYTADGALDEAVFQQKVKETAANTAADLLEQLSDLEKTVEDLRNERATLTSDEDKEKNYAASEEAQKKLADAANVLSDYYKSIVDSDTATAEEKAAAQDGLDRAFDAYDVAKNAAAAMGAEAPSTVASYNLASKVESDSRAYAETAHNVLNSTINGVSAGAVRILGQDALISLNGAEFTSDTNNFTINGLTITANSVSAITGQDAEGNDIYAETSINTAEDVDAIYDMIKGFLKEYNDLIKEMDTLYNADSSKGYEPLTDDEKDAMSDTEIEKWEQKIKDSLLRRDSDLGTLINTFKETMLGSYTVNGKKYSLSSFGISTLGYFKSADNERGVYHIDGDADDSSTSGNTDKLKAMIASDPDAVKGFFTQLVGDLQSKVNDIMTHTDYRSVYHVYDDKRLQTEYDDYTKKIKEQETKLQDLEDRYYKQFSSMETALSKLNSQQSYISSLFGS